MNDTASTPLTAPTKFVFVTGHTFGRRAVEGMVTSSAFLAGHLQWAGAVQLGASRQDRTVGYGGLEELAGWHDVEVRQTVDGSLLSLADWLREVSPRFILVVGWSRIVAPQVLDLPRSLWGAVEEPRNTPRFGAVGMHPSPLPEGRGRAPIPWTLIKGLRHTALTTFFLEDTVDSGAVIAQRHVDVRDTETASSLFLRFADAHYHAGRHIADLMAERRVVGHPQDPTLATTWPRRTPADSRIDPTAPRRSVAAFVRALSAPYPRAFLALGARHLRVDTCRELPADSPAPPGAVLGADGRWLHVAVGDGALALRVVDEDLAGLVLAVEPDDAGGPVGSGLASHG
ncbi:methionyl-tRNA formyltransferase [Plantactinospora sp. KLBMP9567]|uniref:methionyl-tRNA formyltransferase n=1 Tax=Plantactinospora sp. KLBMP9567 TaxID=3085900 RepID=UPI002981FF0E|nr:formyltransferase family protein [Plantactinospora sp. KLBMP9567]MDW5329521.1 formyltransferase family protein [Plantactinospora sp. KLBMP9567]